MKVSIITATKNQGHFLESNLQSIKEQNYSNIEHIIVDSCSDDQTKEIVGKNREKINKYICEEDQGIYEGINKGIKAASGDIIAVLNVDDIYVDEQVISDVVRSFKENDTDSVYGDLVYVDKENIDKVTRYWRAGLGDRAKISVGWMPPHPALFIKKEIYQEYGCYNTDFKISADYEIILRFLYMHRITMSYMHRLCVKMRIGGVSNRSLFSMLKKSYEDYKACKIYGIKKPRRVVAWKNFQKLPQFLKKNH
ncbi:MAG: glycosyltransferase family 2 protein [Candidatus Omnitrophota bacterium]